MVKSCENNLECLHVPVNERLMTFKSNLDTLLVKILRNVRPDGLSLCILSPLKLRQNHSLIIPLSPRIMHFMQKIKYYFKKSFFEPKNLSLCSTKLSGATFNGMGGKMKRPGTTIYNSTLFFKYQALFY